MIIETKENEMTISSVKILSLVESEYKTNKDEFLSGTKKKVFDELSLSIQDDVINKINKFNLDSTLGYLDYIKEDSSLGIECRKFINELELRLISIKERVNENEK